MAAYVPSGHLIFARNRALYAVGFDPHRLRMQGMPTPVLEGVEGDVTSGAVHFSCSDDGTLAVAAVHAFVGEGALPPIRDATLVIIGSVLMPILVGRGGTLSEGRDFVHRALTEVHSLLKPGGWLYELETVAMPWDVGSEEEPARRLTLPELTAAVERPGFEDVEVSYRFRDRVVVRARR